MCARGKIAPNSNGNTGRRHEFWFPWICLKSVMHFNALLMQKSVSWHKLPLCIVMIQLFFSMRIKHQWLKGTWKTCYPCLCEAIHFLNAVILYFFNNKSYQKMYFTSYLIIVNTMRIFPAKPVEQIIPVREGNQTWQWCHPFQDLLIKPGVQFWQKGWNSLILQWF